MKWFRQYPVFASLIAAALVAIVALSGIIALLIVENHRSHAKLKKRQYELRTFAQAGPLLSEAAARSTDERSGALEEQNVEMMKHYRSSSDLDQPERSKPGTPTESTDAFFELASFRERVMDRARAAGVKVAEDERFGFGAYAKSGPERELIPSILMQQRLIEKVLERLFATHPERLLAVLRERPTPQNHSRETTSDSATKDFFAFAPRHSVRVEGVVGGSAIRISFVSDTSVLRDFVNALVAHEPCLLVRGIEADAIIDASVDRKTGPGEARSAPRSVGRRTKFTVVIEAIDFVPTNTLVSASP